MIDYILIEKVPNAFLADGVTPRAQQSPYTVSLDRLGFKTINTEPRLRSEIVPKLDKTYDIQHHGVAGRRYRIQGNIRLDNIAVNDGTLVHRSLREYVAESEAKKLQWLGEHSIICTLIKQIDTVTTVELSECYVSSGLRLSMTSSIAGQPLLRTWSFELAEIYSELDEAAIFDGSFRPIPGALTQLPDLAPTLQRSSIDQFGF